MKFCDGEDKICRYFMWYNGKAICMSPKILQYWSRTLFGIKTGNIKKAYLKQGGECKFYDGRARKSVQS